ncbi:MAG: Tryptophan synthase alpha chain [Labilithrix sp.]|nr:Tryptophan synthase alpha chain [Labilithrix sp.]
MPNAKRRGAVPAGPGRRRLDIPLVPAAIAAAAALVVSCTVFNGLSADVTGDPLNPQGTSSGGDGAAPPPGPTHSDGTKNLDETDVDCGGAGDASRCKDGLACGAGGDCASGVCTGGTCAVPTSTDAVKNGDETDVDCGGSTTGAPKCGTGKGCAANTDCTSDGCDYAKKCAVARSCTSHMGGDTCGTGEVGAAGAVHESCCTALPLSTGVKLDKYKATAGRVRAMVERLNGDVKGWYLASKASLSPAAVAQIDPWVAMLPSGLTGDYGINEQLGSFIYIPDKPSSQQGCFVAGNGTHTYWLPDAVNMFYADSAQGFPQDVLDTKPVNCIPMPLAAAFCAWDGGRLQTFAENKEMFGTQVYPYGTTPLPGGYGPINGVFVTVGPADKGTSAACPTCSVVTMNWANNYQYPNPNPAKLFDYSFYISAPGRFAGDKGPLGHMDAGGDLMELTATAGTGPDDKGRSPTFRWGKQGSWEGHSVGYEGFSMTPMTKYGKTGLRCARD